MSESYYIIDHSNFVYRCKSVYKFSKCNRNGVSINTSVLYGYLRTIKSCIFDNVIIVLDGKPFNSLKLLPTYKGTRNHELDDNNLFVSNRDVIRFLSNVNKLLEQSHSTKRVYVVCSPGQEADQVVASLTYYLKNNLPAKWSFKNAINSLPLESDPYLKSIHDATLDSNFPFEKDPDNKIIISSTDADMAQLQHMDGVYIDSTLSCKGISDSHSAQSVNGVSPVVIPVYKAIFGDVSDNIPPVLKLPAKQTEAIIELLHKIIKDHECCLSFTDAVCKGIFATFLSQVPLIEVLQKSKDLYMRNWNIVNLEYVSTPKLVNYTCDPKSILDKYNLKFSI